ncbi:hypothetical protein [Natronorubrum sp. FCH18a]|uniref:hypothetical protein n=1 Tax=Natronorubrum sp. FCH18a TaxID=3447018 RepID=UPI003F51577C
MVQLSLVLPPEPDFRWQLATQIGVTSVVVHPLEIGDGRTEWTDDKLARMVNWFDDAGLELSVLEGSVPLTDRIRLGRDGRNDDIEVFKSQDRRTGVVRTRL